jgi:hypothetical protein
MAPTSFHAVLALLLTTTADCTGRSSNAPDAAPTDAQSVPADPRAAICPAPDAAPAAVTYDQVQQIFTDNCVTCHDVAGMLDLTAGSSRNNLVNQPAPAPDSCGGILVAPGDPTGSYLYQKLSSATPCYGAQMPLGEFFSNPLPACVIAMVSRWIAEGAPGSAPDGGGD